MGNIEKRCTGRVPLTPLDNSAICGVRQWKCVPFRPDSQDSDRIRVPLSPLDNSAICGVRQWKCVPFRPDSGSGKRTHSTLRLAVCGRLALFTSVLARKWYDQHTAILISTHVTKRHNWRSLRAKAEEIKEHSWGMLSLADPRLWIRLLTNHSLSYIVYHYLKVFHHQHFDKWFNGEKWNQSSKY
jgi:hypothetical protein